MRFTEHELTAALTGAAKTVVVAQRKDLRKDARRGTLDVDAMWEEMDRYQRFKILDGLGDQLLPVLVALPDVEVAAGTRPTFTEAQVQETVEQVVGEEGGRVRRAVVVKARTALVLAALGHLPPRQDPDALTVPDHL